MGSGGGVREDVACGNVRGPVSVITRQYLAKWTNLCYQCPLAFVESSGTGFDPLRGPRGDRHEIFGTDLSVTLGRGGGEHLSG